MGKTVNELFFLKVEFVIVFVNIKFGNLFMDIFYNKKFIFKDNRVFEQYSYILFDFNG